MANEQKEKVIHILPWAIFAIVLFSLLASFYSFILYPALMPKSGPIIVSDRYKVEEIKKQEIAQESMELKTSEKIIPSLQQIVPPQKLEHFLEIGPIISEAKLEEIKKSLEEGGIKPEVSASEDKVEFNRVMIGQWKGSSGALLVSEELKRKGYEPVLIERGKGFYNLAVGLFLHEKNAQKAQNKLEGLGYFPTVDKISITKDVYRIKASISSDEGKVRAYLEKLQQEGIQASLKEKR